jgi:pimeloyl-ACP methyl ester carboxylesterase
MLPKGWVKGSPSAGLLRFTLQVVLVSLIVPQRTALAQTMSTEYNATRIDFSVSGAVGGFVIKPNRPDAENLRPWVWYAPTFVKATPRIGKYPNASLAWLFTRLLDKGVWIGGVDVGESYGNFRGRKEYTRFYKYVRKRFGLSQRPCLLAQSRGGLMLYNWAAENSRDVACIAGIYPVTNVDSWPGLGSQELQQAYGMSEAQLEKNKARINPVDRLSALARHNVPILHLHGDADKVVSLQQNTIELVSRYQALGGKADVEVIRGKGHEEVPEFFQSERLLDFLLEFLNPERRASGRTCPTCAPRA